MKRIRSYSVASFCTASDYSGGPRGATSIPRYKPAFVLLSVIASLTITSWTGSERAGYIVAGAALVADSTYGLLTLKFGCSSSPRVAHGGRAATQHKFGRRYEWLTPQFVTVAMAGAMIPDLSRLDLLLSDDLLTPVLGDPFDWGAVHVLGGSLVAVAIGTLLVPPAYRRHVGALLPLGVASHLALDLLLLNPSGYSYAVRWPITGTHPPSPDRYLSSDRWPAVCSVVLAAVVWYARSQW